MRVDWVDPLFRMPAPPRPDGKAPAPAPKPAATVSLSGDSTSEPSSERSSSEEKKKKEEEEPEKKSVPQPVAGAPVQPPPPPPPPHEEAKANDENETKGQRCPICNMWVKDADAMDSHQKYSSRCLQAQGMENLKKQCNKCGRWIRNTEHSWEQHRWHCNGEGLTAASNSKWNARHGTYDRVDGTNPPRPPLLRLRSARSARSRSRSSRSRPAKHSGRGDG